MARTTQTLLGKVARHQPPPPAETAPAMSTAEAGREAVRQRWRKPPEAKTAMIRAIVVDPAKRSVTEVRLPTEPGDTEAGLGTQIAQDEVEKIVGSDAIESLDLADGEVVLVDGLRQSETEETWRFGEDDAPIAGPGVIVGYDTNKDAYSDTTMSLDEARKAIVFEDAESDQNQQE